jgi:hypothetical protein
VGKRQARSEHLFNFLALVKMDDNCTSFNAVWKQDDNASTNLLLQTQTQLVHLYFDTLRAVKSIDEIKLPEFVRQPQILETGQLRTD